MRPSLARGGRRGWETKQSDLFKGTQLAGSGAGIAAHSCLALKPLPPHSSLPSTRPRLCSRSATRPVASNTDGSCSACALNPALNVDQTGGTHLVGFDQQGERFGCHPKSELQLPSIDHCASVSPLGYVMRSLDIPFKIYPLSEYQLSTAIKPTVSKLSGFTPSPFCFLTVLWQQMGLAFLDRSSAGLLQGHTLSCTHLELSGAR